MFDKSPGATLDYHRSMLVDTTRTRAFELAIQARVKPEDDIHRMATQRRTGIIAREPTPVRSGEVACDEV
ncbi:MAG: hypothetical protein WAT36_15945 [Chromatiaceae bacterium]